MKALCTCGILLLFMSSYTCAQTKWDFYGMQLFGPVHTVQIEEIEISMAEGKEVQSSRWLHQRIVYDRNGNEIERVNFNRDGSIENRTVQLIDARGCTAGWENYDAKGQKTTGRSEWDYDKNGNRIEARVYMQEILSDLTKDSYDAAGHLVEEVIVTDSGEWKQTEKLDYDADGRLVKTTFDTNGTIEWSEQSYDGAGNLVKTKHSRSDDRNVREAAFSYDAKGREIERTAEDSISRFKLNTFYDTKGRVSKKVTQFEYKQPNTFNSHAPKPGTIEFRYNDSDQVVEETAYSPEGRLLRQTVNDYDGAGRLRSQTHHTGDVVTQTSYEYDRFGNRVKITNPYTDSTGRSVVYIQQYTIDYYTSR